VASWSPLLVTGASTVIAGDGEGGRENGESEVAQVRNSTQAFVTAQAFAPCGFVAAAVAAPPHVVTVVVVVEAAVSADADGDGGGVFWWRRQ